MNDDPKPKAKAAPKAKKAKAIAGSNSARETRAERIKNRDPSLTKKLQPRTTRQGAPKGSFGVPPFVATDEMRSRVCDLLLVATSHKLIAELLGISEDTLQKHFRPEIDRTVAIVNAKIARGVVRRALEGDQKAAEFWLHTRAGFKKAREDDGEGSKEIRITGGLPS